MHTHAWCSKLMKEVAPTSSQEYILQSVTNLAIGRQVDSRDHLKVAQQYFQLLLGASASEWDTITSPVSAWPRASVFYASLMMCLSTTW